MIAAVDFVDEFQPSGEAAGMFLALARSTARCVEADGVEGDLRADAMGATCDAFLFDSDLQNIGLPGAKREYGRWACVAEGMIVLIVGWLSNIVSTGVFTRPSNAMPVVAVSIGNGRIPIVSWDRFALVPSGSKGMNRAVPRCIAAVSPNAVAHGASAQRTQAESFPAARAARFVRRLERAGRGWLEKEAARLQS